MTTTDLALALCTAALGAVTIVAKVRGDLRVVLVAKPFAMAAVVATYVAGAASAPRGAAWYLVGTALAASIVGDVLLELPSDRFVAGLVSFLVAHGLYVAAFGLRAAEVVGFASRPAFWLPLLVVGGYSAVMFRALAPRLGDLRVPVAAYIGAITLMAWQAAAAFALDSDPLAGAGLAGAALFVASDTLLALDRFRAPVPAGHALVLGTYFAAQWCIAWSARAL